MGLYDTLKNSAQPKPLTPAQEVSANYAVNLNYLFEYVLQECAVLNEQGKRQFTAYTQIYQNADNQRYYIRWTTCAPEDTLQSFQSNWTRKMDAAKGFAPYEMRNDKNMLFNFAVNLYFPDQSNELRDKLLFDLRQRFVEEGFPPDCITAIDMQIILPTSYSFWTGKDKDFVQACTCYYVKFSASW